MLVLYFASVALFTAHERRNLFLIVQEMEAIQSNEELLRQVSDRVAHALIDTQALIDFPASDARQTAASELAAKSMQAIRVGLQGPRRAYALLDRDAVALERAVAAMDVAVCWRLESYSMSLGSAPSSTIAVSVPSRVSRRLRVRARTLLTNNVLVSGAHNNFSGVYLTGISCSTCQFFVLTTAMRLLPANAI